MSRDGSGFTLLEVMVALAIFAAVAATVYARTGQVAAGAAQLETRTLATWIARNALLRLELEQHSRDAEIGAGRETRRLRMAGREWRVETEIEATSAPNLHRVTVVVRAQDGARDPTLDGEAGVAARMTGFLGRF